MPDNKADIFEQMFEQVSALASEVEANRDLIRDMKAKMASLPGEERIGAIRGELLIEIEKIEKRAKEREMESGQRIEEKRHGGQLGIERLIERTVQAEHTNADAEFPRRLAENLPAVLDKLADEARERRLRRVKQLAPWVAMLLMLAGFLLQMFGIGGSSVTDLGNSVVRLK